MRRQRGALASAKFAKRVSHAAMPTRGAITYLAQERHSSYGRDSIELLKVSVASLFRFYNRRAGDDTLFFHTGISMVHRRSILGLCTGAHARFLELPTEQFQLPSGVPPQRQWMQRNKFSAGYRHMIRFYTTGIWDLVARLGYEYVMRLDEDSVLWSPIRYNIFDFMAARGIEYGFRLASWEHGFHRKTSEDFHTFIRGYVKANQLSTGWLLDTCVDQRGIDAFTLEGCGEPYGAYNNFFVSRLAFWKRRDVRHYLDHIERSHKIYTMRWNDILWQSTAIKLFMDRERVHMFQDFAYEHTTFRPMDNQTRKGRCKSCAQCFSWGGIVLGNARGDDGLEARQRLREIASTWPCKTGFYLPRPCLRIANHTRVESLTLGQVSAEQPSCDREPMPYYCKARPASNATYPLMAWETNACACNAEFHTERHPGYGMIRFWRCYKKLMSSVLPGVVVNRRPDGSSSRHGQKNAEWQVAPTQSRLVDKTRGR